MKATGIVRRIDDLGRVVIPKEIRRTMRIREGDPLEIFTDREGEVIFKKYSPIGELGDFALQYAEALNRVCGLSIAVCDRDAVIAVSGLPKKGFSERRISDDVGKLTDGRSVYQYSEGGEKLSVTADSEGCYVSCAAPIIAEGDVAGCVISVSCGESAPTGADTELKLVQTAAVFLGKQLES